MLAKTDIIRLDNVWKVYRMGEVEVSALKGVSAGIKQGEFVAITGASGSGKSTMMNIVGCLDTPTRGVVYLDGRDIAKMDESDLATIRGRRIGFVFQQFNLVPTMSAMENVMLPMEFQDMPDDKATQRAKELLTLVGLGDRLEHRPSQLSGGQQQRVAIARALANSPEVLLADEPTGNLDSSSGNDVMSILRNLWKKEGKTVIIVTHDIKLAGMAERVIRLKDGLIVSGG